MKLSLLALSFVSLTASASEPAACRAKIVELLAPHAPQAAKGPAGAGEQYRLSADKSCGVEYVADKAHLTITRFAGAGDEKSAEAGLKKFETMLLDETELSSGGRVRSQVECEIQGDSVIYKTKLPIFSDGVRTPFQEKWLEVTRNDDGSLYVFIESRITVLRSKIDCTLPR